ncbi:AbrB/MazE/SpoVT family DNA-binding domain-containing protein [Paucibacter sp. KCTC 42545]|uniref:AbrB/MazE/SpoVT family DNA-binding domain-containing protein n=1 Tax=Paucibacter sp. KCTC 42545 TaxID=1768242 RepID=UPI000A8945DB|nr:hypothetical protein [Paucibacter sp. KCTC 42545]
MLAKLTVKNQLTLPKSVTQSLGPVQYFEVQEKAGQIILTPVRIQRGDALRAKLAELEIDAKTIESSLDWASGEKAAKKTLSKKKPTAETPAPSAKKAAAKPLSPKNQPEPVPSVAALKKTSSKTSSKAAANAAAKTATKAGSKTIAKTARASAGPAKP